MTADLETLPNEPSDQAASDAHEMRRNIFRRVVQIILQQVIGAALLFGAAGTLHWPRAWVWIGFSLLLLIISTPIVLMKNPEIIAARARIKAGTKAFDKVIGVFALITIVLGPIVAGLDVVRFQWSAMPFFTLYVGLFLHLAGWIPITWALIVNRHLEGTVRIQTDRGHKVVSTGPYQYVRHPMYIGMLLQSVAAPLVLGSFWQLAPVFCTIAIMVVRTSLEDRTLRAELEGYEAFTQTTRYRLLPGVW